MADPPPITQSYTFNGTIESLTIFNSALNKSSVVITVPNELIPIIYIENFSIAGVTKGIGLVYKSATIRLKVEVPSVTVFKTSDRISQTSSLEFSRENTVLDNNISTVHILQQAQASSVLEVYRKMSKVNYDVTNVNKGDQKLWASNVIDKISDQKLIKSITKLQHYSYSDFDTSDRAGYLTLRESTNNLRPRF